MGSLLPCLIILALLVTVPALAPADDLNRTELMLLLETPEGSEYRFRETKELAFLDVAFVTQGRLIFTPPDRLVKQIDEPDPSRYQIEAGKITISRPGKEDQVIDIEAHPQLRLFVDTLRALLTGDLKALEQYYKLELVGVRSEWRLQLTPLDSRLAKAIRSLTISGRDKNIDQMVTQEQNGDQTTLTLLHGGG